MTRDHCREFPRALTSLDEMPENLGEQVRASLSQEQSPIHLYQIPQPRGFWEWFHDTPPRNNIFCIAPNQVLFVRETPDGGVMEQSCRAEEIVSIQVGTILLKSWLTLKVPNGHSSDTLTIQYGTVFSRPFRDSILWLRVRANASNLSPQHTWRMPGEEHVSTLPLKFNNAARYYWLHGETALASCFVQPVAIPVPIFGRLSRSCTNATALVVSDCALHIIQEQGDSHVGRWGQTWHFCDFNRLIQVSVGAGTRFPELVLELGHAGCQSRYGLTVPFNPSQRTEIDRVIAAIPMKGRQDSSTGPERSREVRAVIPQ